MRTAFSSSFHMAGTGVRSPSDTRYTFLGGMARSVSARKCGRCIIAYGRRPVFLVFRFFSKNVRGCFCISMVLSTCACKAWQGASKYLLVADGLEWIRGRGGLCKGAGEVPDVETNCNMCVTYQSEAKSSHRLQAASFGVYCGASPPHP